MNPTNTDSNIFPIFIKQRHEFLANWKKHQVLIPTNGNAERG